MMLQLSAPEIDACQSEYPMLNDEVVQIQISSERKESEKIPAVTGLHIGNG